MTEIQRAESIIRSFGIEEVMASQLAQALKRHGIIGGVREVRVTKWVPLVSWETGSRVVIGEAEVVINDDGSQHATGAVKSDKVQSDVKHLSIAFVNPQK